MDKSIKKNGTRRMRIPDSRRPGLGIALLLVLISLPSAHGTVPLTGAPEPPRCKYSVRDVGFVDVHSFGWQIKLRKPAGLSVDEFADLSEQVRKVLGNTNLSHLWLEADSEEWLGETDRNAEVNQPDSLLGIVGSTSGQSLKLKAGPLPEDESDRLLSSLRLLLDSPFRQKSLVACADSLCVVMLVEGEDAAKNRHAREMLDESITRIGKQMWELEKPTRKAPTGLLLSRQELPSEKWFLDSLGIPDFSEPVFVILYGKGRRLGEPIPLSQANATKLVGRAAVCGGDCECDLDRDWLYGHQFIFRWTSELEQQAVSTLNFDPQAAYVKSEVAAIVRKTPRSPTNGRSIDLGPGLIIHDLEPIERQTQETNTGEKTPANLGPAGSSDPPEINREGPGGNRIEAVDVNHPENRDTNPARPIGMHLPFSMLIVLVVAAGLAAVWFFTRGGN